MEGLKHTLHQSTSLHALATTPLFLSMLLLAYHGKPAQELLALVMAAPTEQQHLLFHNYVERTLQRKGTRIHAPAQQHKHWLASQMAAYQQSELYLEQFQMDWLPKRQRAFYQWSIGLIAGLVFGLVVGLGGLAGGLLAGLATGLGATLQHYTLRLWLGQARCAPPSWRYVGFLDDSVDQLLLRKVGEGYLFRHRLLQDYFAALDSPLPQPELPQPSQAVPLRVCSACGYQEDRPAAGSVLAVVNHWRHEHEGSTRVFQIEMIQLLNSYEQLY